MIRIPLFLLVTLSTGCTIRQVVPRPVTRGEVQHNFQQAFHGLAALVQDGSVYCSGAFYKEYVVTAKHCVDHTTVFDVAMYRHFDPILGQWSRYYKYSLAYTAPDNVDLAILSPASLTKGEHGNLTLATAPHLGEPVFAFGHPLGRAYHFTEGRITAEKRVWHDEYLTFSNVSAYPGNSGGPLLNDDGEIVGIVVIGITYGGTMTNNVGSIHVDDIRSALQGADLWTE